MLALCIMDGVQNLQKTESVNFRYMKTSKIGWIYTPLPEGVLRPTEIAQVAPHNVVLPSSKWAHPEPLSCISVQQCYC